MSARDEQVARIAGVGRRFAIGGLCRVADRGRCGQRSRPRRERCVLVPRRRGRLCQRGEVRGARCCPRARSSPRPARGRWPWESAQHLRADVSVATTGVGGPDPEEGEPPGTVYIATSVDGQAERTRHEFDGDPAEVIEQTIEAALTQLETALTG